MKVRDSKRRLVKNVYGEIYTFNLRRFRCESCKKIHVELPDCLLPYKTYSKKTIEDVKSGKCDYYIVDDSTVRRWKKL